MQKFVYFRKTLTATLAGLTFLATAGTALAAIVQFVPPNDPTGSVFTTNLNDGYDAGRGIVFLATSNTQIDSVGIFHDLTNINLDFEVAQVFSSTGSVTDACCAASGV